MHIKIGTRGSQLALWQATFVQQELERAGATCEIVIIETKGDQILDRSLAAIGSKGLFTEELELQLENGTIDIAVHSCKDVQTELKEGLYLIAITEREVVNDVLVSKKNIDIQKRFIVGTSSTRRRAQLSHFYPHIQYVEMRGNLQTRIRKMEEGACDALLLAYAGVHRMGYNEIIVHQFSTDKLTPAVGQGTLAIEASERLPEEKKRLIRSTLNHEATERCIWAERTFLKHMEGGCSVPVFGLCKGNGKNMALTGGVISLDGSTLVKNTIRFEKEMETIAGKTLAQDILEAGGNKILNEIKNKL
ncbi:MAG: hydroxymethylbilane synthase [Cytophagaceae bacterium]|jgi:hydroxymethylbilane synthase|nr:hydroxymethylbilane synthase [Cytophagaceae bacterium]